MGSIYKRGNRLWLCFKDTTGKWRYKSTGLEASQRKKAKDVLDRIEARIAAGKEVGEDNAGAVTVARYAARWIDERKVSGVRSVRDDETRLKHALNHIGDLEIESVRSRHVRNVIRALKRGPLAARTINHVYGTLHTMFRDAVVDELIDSNPCVLRKGELPKKRDKDPTWRAGAVFTRGELESLISDERIPLHRRVVWAVLFLAGVRFGEAAALRWSRYNRDREPLGCLLVAESYDTKTKRVGPLKTETPREVPVHPALASLLAEWRLIGWRATFERNPGPDDLLLPYPPRRGEFNAETFWRSDVCRKRLDADCKLLGFRHRRVHDARRTFISLARSDGARADVLRWATHGRPEGIMNVYSELPWELLAGEVAKLKISVSKGEVIEMRRAAPDADPFDSVFDSGDNSAESRRKNDGAGGNRSRAGYPRIPCNFGRLKREGQVAVSA